MTRRLRIFAGPNGSGKSTIVKVVEDAGIHIGIFCNADEYKKSINKLHYFDFSDLNIDVDSGHFLKSLKNSPLYGKMGMPGLCVFFKIKDNKISFSPSYEVNDYFTSFLASYIRERLLKSCDKFSFETVMSHSSKLDFMAKAKKEGFKVYLYFVSLISPDLNVARVKSRVEEGGHDVPEDKIRERYKRTMNMLLPAMRIADESYIFDNSRESQDLFAVVKKNTLQLLHDSVPSWFQNYVLNQLKD